MLINLLVPGWESNLEKQYAALPAGARLVLLIDGAFAPMLFQPLDSHCKPFLLFEFLPGCSTEARNVSPFVVKFDPENKSLTRLLKRCSEWPMLSVLTTYESAEQLAERLSAWCIVEVGGQNFNFRFADTRRLPKIFETLTQQQRRGLVGNTIGWHYISRDGSWSSLLVELSTISLSLTDKAVLNETQFGQLLVDSEPDEMWVRLLDRGIQTDLLPSHRHALLSSALHVADRMGLDEFLQTDWCMHCIQTSCSSDLGTLQATLIDWISKNARNENETLSSTA
jgi:hypothetical protein